MRPGLPETLLVASLVGSTKSACFQGRCVEDVPKDVRFAASSWKTWIQEENKFIKSSFLTSNVFQKTTAHSSVLAQPAHVFPENTRRGAAVACFSWSTVATALWQGPVPPRPALRVHMCRGARQVNFAGRGKGCVLASEISPGALISLGPQVAMDTLAEWLRRRPAKPMGSPRVGSNPTGVVFAAPWPE